MANAVGQKVARDWTPVGEVVAKCDDYRTFSLTMRGRECYYVIELKSDGQVYGPFDTGLQAFEFSLARTKLAYKQQMRTH